MKPQFVQLSEPQPLEKGALRIIPLGGLGEVGRNMNVVEYDGKLLIVDCGVLFPEESQPGVDLILPDFTWIADRMEDVVGLVLTHGHEDHIGAVPYLAKLRDDIPTYGSELTLAFTEPKLREHRLPATDFNIVNGGDRLSVGPFDLEFVSVTHSIPDALAVRVKTPAGTVLITGDFKIDHQPLDNKPTDLQALARIGGEGVDLFMVDSTNAEVPGFIPSEREIAPVLNRLVEEATGQVVVASFASHVHRVQMVMNAAHATGRKVGLVGRSMERNMKIAQEKGYLNVPEGLIIPAADLNEYPPEERLWMATGSQGEPMAALARMSVDSHRFVTLDAGDRVILAASLIPGNETDVNRVINDLTVKGIDVFHRGNAKVHVSGHACQGELLTFYNIVRPKNVMPIHGEIRHLVANGNLAISTGVKEKNIALADGGMTVDLKDGHAWISGQVPCERVYVDGKSIGEITEDELVQRRTLAAEGFVSVFAVVDKDMGQVLSEPVIRAVGMAESSEVFDEILPELSEALAEAAAPGGVDSYALQQVMRRVLGRWVSRRLRRRPMIVPVVVLQ